MISKAVEVLLSHRLGGTVILTNSGRSGLYLALKALKVSGAVAVSPLAPYAALTPILAAGLRPRFIDIDPQTLNMDPKSLLSDIDQALSSVMAIHLAGLPVNLPSIHEALRQKGISVIEDCCQSFGAHVDGVPVGSRGDCSVYTFHYPPVYARGGAIMTSPQLAVAIRHLLKYLPRKELAKAQGDLGRFHRRNRQPSIFSSATVFNKLVFELALYENYQRRARLLYRALAEKGLDLQSDSLGRVYTKIMIKRVERVREKIMQLRKLGVNAQHLTGEYLFLQPRVDRHPLFRKYATSSELRNYLEIHDNVISIIPPVIGNVEEMAEKIAKGIGVRV